MIAHMAEKISSYFILKNFVKREDEEVYCYSFEILLATLTNLLSIYLIALLMGKVWETTLFIIGFIPLRSMAGGYHAKTHLRCLIILLANYVSAIVMIILAPERFYTPICIFCACLSVILIWLLSPVADKNKPLNTNEKKLFKRRSRISILIYAVVILIGIFIFQNRVEFLCVSLGIVSVSLSLIVSRIRNEFMSGFNGCQPLE